MYLFIYRYNKMKFINLTNIYKSQNVDSLESYAYIIFCGMNNTYL